MRSIDSIRLLWVILALVGFLSGAQAQTDRDTAETDRAIQEFDKGNTIAALSMTEAVLSRSPDHPQALFRSALFNFHLNNLEAARGRLERLVRVSGSFFSAWELMVQVTQAQGDLERRNEAVDRVKIAIHSALDPEVRRRADFARERIRTPAGDVVVVDFFERSGSDYTRYQFIKGDPRTNVDIGLVLRTDAVTTQNWEVTALLPPDKQLFHLDLVDPVPGGGEKVAIYQYYVGQPDFDTVNAKVMQILRGEVQPLSGEPGSLQGILKPK